MLEPAHPSVRRPLAFDFVVRRKLSPDIRYPFVFKLECVGLVIFVTVPTVKVTIMQQFLFTGPVPLPVHTDVTRTKLIEFYELLNGRQNTTDEW